MTLDTPDKIMAFRLLSLRAQLKLEAKGLKSSGGSIRPRIAKEFGLSSRAKREDFIQAINKKLEELQA